MIGNLFAHIPDDLPEEFSEQLLDAGNVRIERIASRGHASPEEFWYDQPGNEWVVLLKGHAKVQFEGEENARDLTPGDYLHIPAHLRHRVTWTTPHEETIWLAVFFG